MLVGILSKENSNTKECRTFRPRTFRPRTFRPGHFGHGRFGHGKCQGGRFGHIHILCVMHFFENN